MSTQKVCKYSLILCVIFVTLANATTTDATRASTSNITNTLTEPKGSPLNETAAILLNKQQVREEYKQINGSTSQTTTIKVSTTNNCSVPCSNEEFAYILSKITGEPTERVKYASGAGSTNKPEIRKKCLRELVGMIKDLAAGELEMKTLLEFASSTLPISRQLDLSSLKASYANERAQFQQKDLPNRAQQQQQGSSGVENCNSETSNPTATKEQAANVDSQQSGQLLGDETPGLLGSTDEEKTKFLPKLVANVDHFINSLERFTSTREWSALMRVFKGLESILAMFKPISSSGSASEHKANSSSINRQETEGASKNSSQQPELERELPVEVQTLTSSLNQLFPWHVWPWNNIDLYSTLDTFLNHGIFAFSKTTSGPQRRIDHLSMMLETLFKSLKHDSFPKKCNDWSKIICDLDSFHNRLVLFSDELPTSSNNASNAQVERQEQLKKLGEINENRLTQELTCIMFSSLSMKKFGAQEKMFESSETSLATGSQLQWDKLVRKGLRLYRLAREALNDKQWQGLQKQLQTSWTQTKISDRVIMLARIAQLLTNCHMPKEILESALWKDIYKYKNALNQLSDIVIEELNRSSENGKFTVEQLAIGSKNLEQILSKFLHLLPRLIEAISKTIVDGLPELVNRFFNQKVDYLKGPCKGYSLAELIPSLADYKVELVELELLVCKQLSTKPSITMAQINNLTNEFLSMVFSGNFSGSFGGSLQSFAPKFWAAPISGAIQKVPSIPAPNQQASSGYKRVYKRDTSAVSKAAQSGGDIASKLNETSSIIDELVVNPRLAQIVAILQSSALDPPEVHAELPEFDWVEAGTSVALLYEAIQRLMSFEGVFSIFPDIPSFQDEIMLRAETSKQLFKSFGKRDKFQLLAYSLDTVMPVALRTFQPLDSFNSECLATFRDIFGDVSSFESSDSAQQASQPPNVAGDPRRLQCAISAANFASYALNNITKTFNLMLKSIMNQMAVQQEISSKRRNTTSAQNNHCVLFDGSITTLMDNLPQIVDLTLETILIASTSPQATSTTTKIKPANQLELQVTLRDTLCSTRAGESQTAALDPFGDQTQLVRKQRLRDAICHLLHESSLATCGEALKVREWTSTMKELNVTWFEVSPLGIEPSFRGILLGVHEFLDLFGKVKPSSMSDGLIARVLNFGSYWTTLVNKAVSSFDKYREKRFELALQVLVPIIGDNLLPEVALEASNSSSSLSEQDQNLLDSSRRSLKLSVFAAKSLLDYLQSSNGDSLATSGLTIAAVTANGTSSKPYTTSNTNRLAVERHFKTLFDWADKYSPIAAESLLKTAADNLTKLETLIGGGAQLNSEGTYELRPALNGSTEKQNSIWASFCSSPTETYLDFEPLEITSAQNNKATLPTQIRYINMNEAKENLCSFNWDTFNGDLLEYGTGSLVEALDQYSTRQLIRVSLTKWGQVLDLVTQSGNSNRIASKMPKFLTLNHWQTLQEKLPSISPLKDEPTNLTWMWSALDQLVLAWDSRSVREQSSSTNATSTSLHESLVRMFDQLNCALDTVKGGITWDNLANIYQDRQDILAAHSILNNGIELASAGANTFLAHKKFQRFLNDFVKPKMGLGAFCDMRDRSRLETIFVSSNDQKKEELSYALESFQEFICDTNLETLVQNLNPIAFCYQSTTSAANTSSNGGSTALIDSIDRFFKLSSLAILDAKLIETIDSKPPIFDKNQWDQLRVWWLNQTEVHQGNSGLALTLVRIFQTLDSINSNHVVWRAIFRSVYELSEVSAYLLRAAELERTNNVRQANDQLQSRLALPLALPGKDLTPRQTELNSSSGLVLGQQQRLASTLANVMFPEANNFVSFRTFKQLRYLKSISDYFINNDKAQTILCQNNSNYHPLATNKTSSTSSKLELLNYNLDSKERLVNLLCHYHSSQWLTVMNIVLSRKTSSLSRKTNYMTRYLSMLTKDFNDSRHLATFIHSQQLENIESISNKTVVYLIALSKPFRTLKMSKISNMSWHSLPQLLDQIDGHLCLSKFDGNSSAYQTINYEPKKPDIETILCKLPSWNISQVYDYFSENIDLQNMISLVVQNNRTASALLGITTSLSANHQTPFKFFKNETNSTLLDVLAKQQQQQQQLSAITCITPFKFASKWLKIVQDLIDEAMSKSMRDRIHKCLNVNKKSQSAYSQTMRVLKIFNTSLATLNDLTVNNSWQFVRKTWASISYALLNKKTSAPSTGSLATFN